MEHDLVIETCSALHCVHCSRLKFVCDCETAYSGDGDGGGDSREGGVDVRVYR